MDDQHNTLLETPAGKNGSAEIRLIAFTEPSAQGKSEPVLLHVFIVNKGPENVDILKDLDSINIPQSLQPGGKTVPGSDLIHIDFGVSGEAAFIQVAAGECLKITLLLREEQLTLLEHVKQIWTTVKIRDASAEKGEVTTLLLPARVYMTNH